MSQETKSKSFSPKDYISLGISIFAFLLSFTSFYYSNIRVEDNLQVRIIAAGFKSHDSKVGETIPPDTIVVQVAFLNIGNRQSIIFCPWYHFGNEANSYFTGNSFSFDNSDLFPVVLQPHEMKLVDLEVALSTANMSSGFEETVDTTLYYKKYLNLTYSALNSEGKFHSVYGNLPLKILKSKNSFSMEIESYNSKDLNSFPSVEIY